MADARELSRRLAARAPDLALELFPNGKREGAEWRCGSLAGERGRSLSIHLTGSRAGVWSDFASGQAGDALALVAAARYGGDVRRAILWARSWLGLENSPPPTGQTPVGPIRQVPASNAAADIDAEASTRRRFAQRLFLSAQPSLVGTPAAEYLAARGIDLTELGRQPRSLRFHPSLFNRESGITWPAMVAAVSGMNGEHIATHRTWLHRPHGGKWGKAPLVNPKMCLGSVAGGAVRLWRGASGKPMADAPMGETVAIAEGIETALSVVLACPELRVLGAVSLAGMGRVQLPPSIKNIIVCADNDHDNSTAAQALDRAVARFIGEGRSVRVARSPIGSDFNDLLQDDAA